MNEKNVICSRCKGKCKEQVDSNPVWFGKYKGDQLVEVICIDCWKKGEKWEESE